MKALRLRLAISFIVLLVVLAYALPNIPAIGNSPLGALMQDRISLGLDLKGGMNLTLGVDVEKAVQNTLSVTGQDIRDRAEQEKITVMKPRINAEGLLEITLPRAEQASAFAFPAPRMQKLPIPSFIRLSRATRSPALPSATA